MTKTTIKERLKTLFNREGLTDLPIVVVVNTPLYPVQTFPGGKLIDNYIELGAITTSTITVPPGKRWLLYGGFCEIDTSATIVIEIRNADEKIIMQLAYQAASTNNLTYPNKESSIYGPLSIPIPMKEGDYIYFIWGAAQTSPTVSAIVLEIDME